MKAKEKDINEDVVPNTEEKQPCDDNSDKCSGKEECPKKDTCNDEENGDILNKELASEEVLILKNNIATLEEKVRYHQAELINYRKRKDEEVSNMLKYANQDLIMEILPLVDNFERAIKLSEKDENIAKFVEGFKMIYSGLINTLHKFGVEEIKSDGEHFDPVYHEALLIEENKDKEDGIILETLVTGYIYKGRVIRPSSVKVNKLN